MAFFFFFTAYVHFQEYIERNSLYSFVGGNIAQE